LGGGRTGSRATDGPSGAVFAGHSLLPEAPARDAAAKLAGMVVLIHLFWLLAGTGLARLLRRPIALALG
jgi:hypothetical protein